MKKCNKCLVEKSLEEFFRDNKSKDGRYSICKQCKQYGTMKWRSENRDIYNAGMRRYNKANYYKLRLNRYKILPEDHQKILEQQKGLCAICFKPPGGKRPLAIDHCRITGRVRGALCYSCNRSIVILDNSGLLERALEYLKP